MSKGRSDKFPKVVYSGCDGEEEINPYMAELMSQLPMLKQSYQPPAFWGSSGNIQTAVHSMMYSRPGLDLSHVTSRRVYTTLSDGTRLSYDVFEAGQEALDGDEDITLAVCPGICNSSEDLDMRVLAHLATPCGYRLAILNHVGVLEKDLTTPRMFNLGSTEEYGAMVKGVLQAYPATKLIAIGYSLGGNIVCKYLGENVEHQKPFICCISLCQGYDFNHMKDFMSTSKSGTINRFFLRRISSRLKAVVTKHWSQLHRVISARSRHREPKRSPAAPAQEKHFRRVESCTYLDEIDDVVTRRVTGHDTIEEYYDWASSYNYLEKIDVATLLVNAEDDPLFSSEVYSHAIDKAERHNKTLFVKTKHGGHLGFFTKTGRRFSDPISWMEKLVMEYLGAMINTHRRHQHNGVPRNINSRKFSQAKPTKKAFTRKSSNDSRSSYSLSCLCSSPLHSGGTARVEHLD